MTFTLSKRLPLLLCVVSVCVHDDVFGVVGGYENRWCGVDTGEKHVKNVLLPCDHNGGKACQLT